MLDGFASGTQECEKMRSRYKWNAQSALCDTQEPVKEVDPAEKAPEPAAEEEEESDGEDWDAKSWDEAEVDKTLKKTGAFRDEVSGRVAAMAL